MPATRYRLFPPLLALGLASCVLQAERSSAPPTPVARTFDAATVARGAGLAAVGNCRSCHTVPGGRPFAGGRALDTPFGTLYSTNITPDPQTGIGGWSEAQFVRAMQEGVDRDGRHLYPAFPYDRFTLAADEDHRAIYAYIMTRPAVQQRNRPHALMFPMNIRAMVGLWKSLYFRPGRFQPDPAQGAAWNRGAYLAEGLGHCGSCHTPRNKLGAEIRARHFDGGEAEGWHAYAINAKNHAPERWTQPALRKYLGEGWHPRHGVSRGPMGDVTEELARADAEDVRAIALYTAWWMRDAGPSAEIGSRPVAASAAAGTTAARIYALACERCHDGTQALPFGGIAMPLSIGVAGESPRNLINVILYGLPAADGQASPVMPGYAGALSPEQVRDLVTWMRASFSRQPPWSDVERHVRAALRDGPKLAEHPVGGTGVDPSGSARAN